MSSRSPDSYQLIDELSFAKSFRLRRTLVHPNNLQKERTSLNSCAFFTNEFELLGFLGIRVPKIAGLESTTILLFDCERGSVNHGQSPLQ
jgi:hypothetical protein